MSTLIIDGLNLIYRTYHATPALTAPNGHPTRILHGALNCALSLVERLKPTRVIVAMESRTPTFRDTEFPEYKSQRKAAPDTFAIEIPELLACFKNLGWQVYGIEGYEADDIIASYLHQNPKTQTYIYTTDKDVVTHLHANAYIVDKKGKTLLKYGVQEMTLKWGMPLNKIPFYLTLVGDAVDNIPGIKRIGAKTALSIVNKYENLDHFLKDTPNHKPNWEVDVERVIKAEHLNTLVTSLVLPEPENTRNLETIISLLEGYNMKTTLQRILKSTESKI